MPCLINGSQENSQWGITSDFTNEDYNPESYGRGYKNIRQSINYIFCKFKNLAAHSIHNTSNVYSVINEPFA